MSADELTAGCYRARSRFNEYGSIGRRLLDRRTNARSPYRFGLYLASNLISRREIHAKQGMPLGGRASRPLAADVSSDANFHTEVTP